jgi:hypothetical protein
MSSERATTQKVGSRLRYLYFRRSRLDAAIQLLEEVIRLREKRPPIGELNARQKVVPAA